MAIGWRADSRQQVIHYVTNTAFSSFDSSCHLYSTSLFCLNIERLAYRIMYISFV